MFELGWTWWYYSEPFQMIQLTCCMPRWLSSKRYQVSMFKFIVCISGHVCMCVLSYSATSDSFCDPMECSSPDFFFHGISQTRILEWITTPFSRESSPPRDQTHVSCIGRQILYYWASGKTINGHITQQICSFDGRIILSLTSSLNSAPVFTQHGFMTSKMHNYSFVEGEL